MSRARPPNRPSFAGTVLLGTALLLGACGSARGQLVSPGKLSAAHTELNGLRNCTNCHELGKRGVSAERCLACHRPLGRRLAEAKGFHATVADQACSDCHHEHFGEDFELVRFDTSRFDHETVGYRLDGHEGVGCRDCHNTLLVSDSEVRELKGKNGALNRTFFGLGTSCLDCHRVKSPHGDQFPGRACDACHTARAWDSAELFDHDAASYPLTGRHRQVACGSCHPAVKTKAGTGVRYVGLAFSGCESCHADVHRGRMAGTCSGCHDTRGWRRLDRARLERDFDHTITGYALLGAHARLECGRCHSAAPARSSSVVVRLKERTGLDTYPRPVANECMSCHLDRHESAFVEAPGGPDCERCHDEEAWIPTSYDLERHNRETFGLTGAHLAVPCLLCHVGSAAADEADAGEANGGESLRFRFESTACAACHPSDDPHLGQFEEEDCAACHQTKSFRVIEFDHDRTRYPLDGAHRDVACAACHVQEETADGVLFRRYKPIGTQCRDCH